MKRLFSETSHDHVKATEKLFKKLLVYLPYASGWTSLPGWAKEEHLSA